MKKFVIILSLFLLSSFLYSQSDETLDKLYENENANTLYSALIVLQAAGFMDEASTISDVEMFLENEKWGKVILSEGEYISTGGFSLLVMEVFNLSHGVMYNFFPNKRYALKELMFKEYILGSPYVNDAITSFNVIYCIGALPIPEMINNNYQSEDDVEDSSEI